MIIKELEFSMVAIPATRMGGRNRTVAFENGRKCKYLGSPTDVNFK